MKRLRRRHGRAKRLKPYVSGHVTVDLTYDSDRGEYRGDLSWPEIDPSGRMSPKIRHHLIKRASADSPDAAAREMIRESGLVGTPVHPGAVTRRHEYHGACDACGTTLGVGDKDQTLCSSCRGHR